MMKNASDAPPPAQLVTKQLLKSDKEVSTPGTTRGAPGRAPASSFESKDISQVRNVEKEDPHGGKVTGENGGLLGASVKFSADVARQQSSASPHSPPSPPTHSSNASPRFRAVPSPGDKKAADTPSSPPGNPTVTTTEQKKGFPASWTGQSATETKATASKHALGVASKGSSTKDVTVNGGHQAGTSANESPAKKPKKRRTVKKWTPQEDEKMRQLVAQFGTRKWSQIGALLEGRNGKQCRERWHNQLDPTIKKTPWGEDEELLLKQLHTKYGNKWAEIARHIPGRTDNAIKNHWNSQRRRVNRAEQRSLDGGKLSASARKRKARSAANAAALAAKRQRAVEAKQARKEAQRLKKEAQEKARAEKARAARHRKRKAEKAARKRKKMQEKQRRRKAKVKRAQLRAKKRKERERRKRISRKKGEAGETSSSEEETSSSEEETSSSEESSSEDSCSEDESSMGKSKWAPRKSNRPRLSSAYEAFAAAEALLVCKPSTARHLASPMGGLDVLASLGAMSPASGATSRPVRSLSDTNSPENPVTAKEDSTVQRPHLAHARISASTKPVCSSSTSRSLEPSLAAVADTNLLHGHAFSRWPISAKSGNPNHQDPQSPSRKRTREQFTSPMRNATSSAISLGPVIGSPQKSTLFDAGVGVSGDAGPASLLDAGSFLANKRQRKTVSHYIEQRLSQILDANMNNEKNAPLTSSSVASHSAH